jgi:DNA processing protein
VTAPSSLTPLETAFPSRLRFLADPPASLSFQGGPVEAARTVAVVGSRLACSEALELAHDLSATLVRAGAVVVSGGAVGVDAAAHEGALRANGRTWAVAGTGHVHCFPAEHAALFDRIGCGPGAMVWPFPPAFKHRNGFLLRNRVLVALSDAVVVVQAGERSGALHAASWARKLGKPLWVVPAAPWMPDFAGSRQLLAEGARPLTAISEFLGAMALAPEQADEPGPHDDDALDLPPEALAVLSAMPATASHVDSIAAASGQTAQAASAALLTLALENVVVEGPPGFFRRKMGHKH